MDRGELQQQIVDLVCRTLRLDAERREAAVTGAPLFDGALGLDSVDLVGLIVAVEQEFGLEFAADADFARTFRDLNSIIDTVQAARGR
jgi:acyl carrier protein